jgi:hypothetical protein
LIADWGYDFLKLDGVGPGSGKSGDNYDNVADVAAWKKAIAATGRPIHLELSWSLDSATPPTGRSTPTAGASTPTSSATATPLSPGRTRSTTAGTTPRPGRATAGPGGWNDLDSLDVGNGAMDGLTKAERQSYATLWAIAKSPLYTGDDLTKLDDYGVSLLTNREVIAVDQSDAPPARPVTPSDAQQVWAAKNADGTYTVALFNLADAPAAVSATGRPSASPARPPSVTCGTTRNLGTYTNKVTQALPAHGSRLFTVTPRGSAVTTTGYEAEAPPTPSAATPTSPTARPAPAARRSATSTSAASSPSTTSSPPRPAPTR